MAGIGSSDSLNPRLVDRVGRVLRPEFLRTNAARRSLAVVLVLLAGAAALRPDSSESPVNVVTASTDLRPGLRVGADDVGLEKRAAASLPDGAITALGDVVGLQVAGPVRRGEVLTDARVLGSRLAGIGAGPDGRVVGVRLADAGMLDVVRPGDVVDVLGATAADHDAPPRLLAPAAVVVGVSTPAATHGVSADRLLLLALPAGAAATVAAAGLAAEMAVTLR